jgi:hypothetical protein
LNVAAFRRLARTAAAHSALVAIENVGRAVNRAAHGADFGQLIPDQIR